MTGCHYLSWQLTCYRNWGYPRLQLHGHLHGTYPGHADQAHHCEDLSGSSAIRSNFFYKDLCGTGSGRAIFKGFPASTVKGFPTFTFQDLSGTSSRRTFQGCQDPLGS